MFSISYSIEFGMASNRQSVSVIVVTTIWPAHHSGVATIAALFNAVLLHHVAGTLEGHTYSLLLNKVVHSATVKQELFLPANSNIW